MMRRNASKIAGFKIGVDPMMMNCIWSLMLTRAPTRSNSDVSEATRELS